MNEIQEERRERNPGRRNTDMNNNEAKGMVWKILGGVITAAIIAMGAFTYSIKGEIAEIKVSLGKLCADVPRLEEKTKSLEVEVVSSKLTDMEMRGRIIFLEKSLELFEKRIANMK